MTMLDRAGKIEPNDCADGKGHTLPLVTCNGPVPDAGTPDGSAPDGGVVTPPGGGNDGGAADAGGNGAAPGQPGSSSGCGCSTPGTRDVAPWGLVLLPGAALARRLRRRARR